MSDKNWNPKIILAMTIAETIFWAKRCYSDGVYEDLGFTISDEFYDKLEETLKYLCPKHPMLKSVGSPKELNLLPGMAAMRKLIEPKEVKSKAVVVEEDDLLGGPIETGLNGLEVSGVIFDEFDDLLGAIDDTDLLG